MPTPQEIRPSSGIINHFHPLIRPAIKALFPGGVGIGGVPWKNDPKMHTPRFQRTAGGTQKMTPEFEAGDIFWANYNDVSRGHPKWWFNKGTSPKSP